MVRYDPDERERRKKYWAHKKSAKQRQIEFRLTFDQWIAIWLESGHYHERGILPHEYCMARHGDVGAYEVGNVSIITQFENNSVAKPFISVANKRRVWTDERRQNNSAAQKRIGNRPPSWAGKKHSPETRQRMSDVQKRRRGEERACRQ